MTTMNTVVAQKLCTLIVSSRKNNSEDWTVNFGTVINKPYRTGKVQNVISHENYNRAGVHDDIALVQLAEEVSFTKYVRRICLPEAKMKLSENDSVVVTGWGTLYMNGKFICKNVMASQE